MIVFVRRSGFFPHCVNRINEVLACNENRVFPLIFTFLTFVKFHFAWNKGSKMLFRNHLVIVNRIKMTFINILLKINLLLSQNLRNQIMTTNVWVEQVSAVEYNSLSRTEKKEIFVSVLNERPMEIKSKIIELQSIFPEFILRHRFYSSENHFTCAILREGEKKLSRFTCITLISFVMFIASVRNRLPK